MKYGVYRLGKARGTTHKYEHIHARARADTYLCTYTRHARKEHTIVADKGKRREGRETRWGMGGLTTWSRFKHSHRIATSASRLTLSHHRYPTFSPSGILLPLLPLLPHASPPPPYTPRDTLSSVVCQDTPAIVSIDAYATRLYARANLPCADRQLSINGGIPHGTYSET